MSRFFSPKYLKYRRALQGQQIEKDRLCRACGYNLRGLRFGGKCPECGVPIRVDDAARAALVDAPIDVIKRLRTGFLVMLACLPALPALPIVMGAMQVGGTAVISAVLALAAVWVAAVWIATPVIDVPDGARRGFTSRSKLRHAARWLQLGWPAFATTPVLVPTLGAGGTVAAAAVTLTAGVAGLVTLAILLGRLAEWCSDDFAERAYNAAAWGLGICHPGILLGLLFTPMMLLACSFTALWMVALGAFFLGTVSLGRAVFWSALIASQRAQRDRELAARTTPGPPSSPVSREPVPLSRPEPEPGIDLPPLPGAEARG